MANPQIVVDFVADFRRIQQAAGQVQGTGAKFKTWAGGVASSLGVAFGPQVVVDFAKKAIGGASDLNETMNKTKVVFGDASTDIVKWSEDSAKAFGLPQQKALDAASTFGDMFTQLGQGRQDAAKNSKALVGLAADLGSFHNVDPSDVLDRIGSAFRGEYDSIQKIVPGITAARVEQEALRMTGKKHADQLTANEKALATQAILFEDSKNAQGDFAETSDQAANKQRIMQAQLEDTAASFGQVLLPAVMAVADALEPFLPLLKSLGDFMQRNSGVIGTVSKALLMMSSPFFLLIGLWDKLKAVAGVVVRFLVRVWNAVVDFFKKLPGRIGNFLAAVWERIRNTAKAVVDFVRRVWNGIVDFFKSVPGRIGNFLAAVWDKIRDGARAVVQWLKDRWNGIVDFFKGLPGRIGSIFSRVVDVMKAPINALIRAWNNLEFHVPGIKLPGPLPDFPGFTIGLPNIPELQRGGILTSPTLFLGGEGPGREIVAPESLLRELLAEHGGNTYTLNVYPKRADAAELAFGFRRLELLRGGR